MIIKIHKFLKSKKASSAHSTYIYAIFIILAFCMISFVYEKYLIVFTSAIEVKEAMKEACIYVMTSNWDEIYYSVREGYSGAYGINGEDLIDSERVYNIMAQNLGTTRIGSEYYKLNSGSTSETIYKYYNIQMNINNTGFKNTSEKYNIDLKLTFEAPISILSITIPIVLDLRNKASWIPKF